MARQPQPLGFFLKGIVALVILFLITLLMTPAPPVLAVRGMIVVGLLITSVKLILRHYNIEWPRTRR